MRFSVQEISFGANWWYAGDDTLLARYPLSYNVATNFRDLSPHFDTLGFAMLLISKSTSMGPCGSGSCDTAAGAWCKRWKHCGGCGTSTLKAEHPEMDSTFVRCHEKEGYQQSLAALLFETCYRSTVPTAVAAFLLCLKNDSGHLYFVTNQSYRPKKFHFETRVCSRQSIFAGFQNVELFSMRVLTSDKYYCQATAWWAQSEVPALLFVSTPLIPAHYSGLMVRGAADDKTRVVTIALTEHVFIVGVMFDTNVSSRAWPQFLHPFSEFNNLSGSLLSSLPGKIMNALKCFGIYKFALRIGTDSALTDLAFHRCKEED